MISRRLAIVGTATLIGSVVLSISGYTYWRGGKVKNLRQSQSVEPLPDGWACPAHSYPSVILIGDSRVSRWTPLPEFPYGRTAVNRGLGGETLLNLSGRFGRDGLICRPNAVVLQTGVNDLVGASFLDVRAAEAVCIATIDRFKALAAESSGAGVSLLITTIIPPGRPTMVYRVAGVSYLSHLVARVNDALVKVNWPENVRLLDIREALSDSSGLTLKREFQDDTLHLSSSGYAVLNNLLVQAMSSEPVAFLE